MAHRRTKGGNTGPQIDLFASSSPENRPKPVPEVKKNPVVEKGPKVFSVSEIAGALRSSLKQSFGRIIVKGEITDYRGIHRSGHLYFSLKDENAQIRVVMWRGSVQKLKFKAEMGLEVIIEGSVDFYPGGGSLQIVASSMEPQGLGALQLRFEQLKNKLKTEGLFDVARKKEIPKLCARIALISGRSTAALQDMLKVFKARYPLAEVFLFHAAVQGVAAPAQIISALKKAQRFNQTQEKKFDVLILARGGGSYEDLFCFNDENLVRSVAACNIPVISAIGHEIDFTLCDFVADQRAATPTHAAEEVVAAALLQQQKLSQSGRRLIEVLRLAIHDRQQKLDSIFSRLSLLSPLQQLQKQKEKLQDYYKRLQLNMNQKLSQWQKSIEHFDKILTALSPFQVLDRGYALIKDKKTKSVLSSTNDIKSGQQVLLQLKDGESAATVD